MCAQLLSLLFLLLWLMPSAAWADDGEQLVDPAFRRGVVLLEPKPVNGRGVPADTLRLCPTAADAPCWHLASWDYRTGLDGHHPRRSRYGLTYADGAFTIARSPKSILTLSVDATKVYDAPRRSSSEPWINFLVETSFASLPLAGTTSVRLRYDLRILQCVNRMDPSDYDTAIHAAQCLCYLHLLNTNPASSDYGKRLWLGVGFFDNREPQGLTSAPLTLWDIGTSTYIYALSGRDVFGDADLTCPRWHPATVDVRAALSDAIVALKDNGHFTDARVDDFTLTDMNYGWELPGTFTVASQLRHLSLQVK